MKKIIILIATLSLSACTTVKEVPKIFVKPGAVVMGDCNEFIFLNEDNDVTPKDLLINISDNKKNYDLCVNLNKSKKEFIEKLDF